jgi:hypothetical protein
MPTTPKATFEAATIKSSITGHVLGLLPRQRLSGILDAIVAGSAKGVIPPSGIQ